MAAPDAEALSSIIGDIYDCILEPAGWTDVLIRITRSVDAAYTTVALASVDDSHGRFAAQSPWDAARMQALQRDYGFDDIPGLRAAVAGEIDSPVATLSIMSEPELQNTPFYREWAEPQGLREACITKFVHTRDRIGLLGCTTRADRDVISGDEQRFLALLSPHLRRAALIGDLLDQTRVAAHQFSETLQSLAVPIVLTGSDGYIHYANECARTMFSGPGPIRSENNALRVQNAVAERALLEAISRAAEADISLGSRGIGLPISAAGQPPAVAYVLPLTKGTARAALRPARAAVFISTTTSASPLPEAVLTTLFDLTPTEGRVLFKIGSGMDGAATAGLMGISGNTLKTHLNRIYAKTSTARQADLVKLIADIGTPLGL